MLYRATWQEMINSLPPAERASLLAAVGTAAAEPRAEQQLEDG